MMDREGKSAKGKALRAKGELWNACGNLAESGEAKSQGEL